MPTRRGEGHGSYLQKPFLGVGERMIPPNETFDFLPGEEEAARFDPRDRLGNGRERDENCPAEEPRQR